ncbi:hypothetical protein ACIBU0_01860 [Streptomyces sp. NPDC049627]|uniref:hypothetical protein n=1 Tax=Streptomyces sp. NPDC049627 TaxID=3365595 RepID=UPI0037A64ADF
MVTAWSPWRIVRTRSGAGPLVRILALAVILCGVLVTHGVHGESVQGHLSTSATASAALSAEGGGHAPSQPGEHCVAGQPQQSSLPAPPCGAASVRASTTADDAWTVRVPGADGAGDRASPAALRAASVVRQV